jgi:hypothetical protein
LDWSLIDLPLVANFIWLCRAGVIRVIDLLRQLNRDAPVQCSCRIPLFPTHGYAGQAKEISIWEDASENLRQCVLETARDLGLAPSDIRDIVCAVLQRRPNRRNWSEYPNVWEEAQEDVYGCQWFQVYDIIEKIWNRFKRADDRSVWDEERAPAFRQAINDFFLTNGIGWQLVKGEIVMFSRILARAITGDPQATLGEILKKHPDLLPRPLYEALSKVWFCFDGGSPSQGRSAAETGGSRTSGRADRRGGDVLEQKM